MIKDDKFAKFGLICNTVPNGCSRPPISKQPEIIIYGRFYENRPSPQPRDNPGGEGLLVKKW